MKRVSFVIISGFTIYFIIASCGKKSNTMEPTFNKPPEASFTVQPSTGFTDTDFQFDASSCSDADDNIDSLKIRWDWENDGTWDTSYLTEKIISHRYDTEGIKTVKMEVQDVEGLTDTDEQQVTVSNTVIDIDGNTYQAIKIGDQWWMAENLKVTHYRNGDPIPNVTDSTEWSNLATEAYCVYENDESIAETYGYLYNWYVVNDSRNIAPEGWHVPTDEEWKELEMFLGMSQSEANGTGWRGTDEGGKLKETSRRRPLHIWQFQQFGRPCNFLVVVGGQYIRCVGSDAVLLQFRFGSVRRQ
jgi:uncharacterized protein (TIGR02145 family)